MRAMPPKFNKERPSEASRTVEENTELYRREEEAKEDSSSDNDEEEADSSQFARGKMGAAQEERSSVQSSSSSSAEQQSMTEPTCQQSSVGRRICFMDRIRKTFGYLPSIFSSSKRPTVSPSVQQGSLSGVPLAPVVEGEQASYLRSSMRSSSTRREEESQRSSKMVAFDVEDSERNVAGEDEEVTVQELGRDSFLGQEKIEKYSAAFAQLQQQLNKRIKAISASGPEKVEPQIQLQTELNNLRAEGDPATLARRTEIKKELKRVKAMPETDPVKLVQIAQLYAESYPPVREAAQHMLNWIQENPERQHELAAAVLVDTTITVLEMASKTVAPHEIEPIKRDKWTDKAKKPFDVLYERTDFEVYEKYKLPSEDLKDEVPIRAANNAFQNLQASQKILKKILEQRSPEEIGKDLHEAQIQKADRDVLLSEDKEECIHAKLDPWLKIPLQERDENYQASIAPLINEMKIAGSKRQSLNKVAIEKARSEPLVVFSDIKNSAIADALSLIQSGLDAADDFREMLLKRSEKK